MIGWNGIYRIYYNNSKDAPMVWNIDDGCGNNQICIKSWRILGADAWSQYYPEADYPYPNAVAMGNGRVEVKNGIAVIYPNVPKV